MFRSCCITLLYLQFFLLLLEVDELFVPGCRFLLDPESTADLAVLEGRLFTNLGACTDDASLHFDIVLQNCMVHDDRVDNLDVLSNSDMGSQGGLLDRRPLSKLGIIANQRIRSNLSLYLAGGSWVPDLIRNLCVLQ